MFCEGFKIVWRESINNTLKGVGAFPTPFIFIALIYYNNNNNNYYYYYYYYYYIIL